MTTTKKAAGVVCMSSSTDSNATTVEKKPGVMDNVVNDIFTRSGNEVCLKSDTTMLTLTFITVSIRTHNCDK